MKFSIGSEDLTAAVGYTSRALPARPANPVAIGLLLSVADGVLTVSGNDGQGGLDAVATVAADVESPGEALVHGKLLADVSARLSGTVSVAVEGTRLMVTAGRAKFALPLMPVEERPASLPHGGEPTGTVDTDALVAAVDQVVVAADPNNSLPALQNVSVELTRQDISLWATDRYRMATRRLAWESSLAKDALVNVLVPAKQLQTMIKGLAKDGEKLTLTVSGTVLQIAGASRSVRISTSDASEYPRLRALIPKETSSTMTVDGPQALQTLSRVAIVSGPHDPVELTFSEDLIALRAGRAEESAGADEVPAELVGDPVTVLFNPVYLRDGLAACGAGAVQLKLNSPTKPAVLSPADDPDYVYLVVPVRPTGG